MTELTMNQWIIYRHLQNAFKKNPDAYVHKKELCSLVGYEWKEESDRNGREIEFDIQKLNEHDSITMSIISNRTGYKIANREELKKWTEEQIEKTIKRLWRLYKLRKKALLDGQLILTEDSDKKKLYIQAFMPKENSENETEEN